MSICGSLCHSFKFINMRFVRNVTFFPIKSTKRFTFMEILLKNFVISFLLSHMFPWLNKFLLTENKQFFSLKQESYSGPHCIFQSVYALNTRSIKTLRRSVARVLITLLIKQ